MSKKNMMRRFLPWHARLKHRLTMSALLLMASTGVIHAQRMTDALDRGLVAVYRTNGTNEGTFLSWRVLPNEYFDVTYNVYRNGTKLNSSPLQVSNFVDTNGSQTASYTVTAVVKGVEQTACTAVTPWLSALQKYTTRTYAGYLDITLQNVYSKADHSDITSDYSPNDASVADLDGDGELEIILKRLNTADAANLYRATNTDYAIIEAYKLNGQRLWWIDCGPNMVSLNSTEINAVAYDWDQDGKAEVLLRGADGMIIHKADGSTQVIGNASVNTRSVFAGATTAQYAWTHTGNEYLIYMNGQTGATYQVTDYPLKRLESGETDEKTAWGDNYGHRSSKYFFGAPFLDGRKPSIFLARGIYTREKMIALDVDPISHKLTTRWTWNCNDASSSWYGQGYHNFTVADVDWDGRDEIVYGSMVIDDNGNGLSTTGLGHGDAQHVSDFNPYIHGQEMFAANEDRPACNYRDATTSNIYYRLTASNDDGRALMGNFSNNYHGAQGRSTISPMISSITNASINNDFIAWSDLNARIYWDGDLLEEILNSPGTAKEAKIDKPGTGRMFTSSGCNMNNDSKNNPCFQGDILGDWREEIILRHGSNGLRIYTTAIPTDYRIPTLWADHQYRQSEVWQMCAYNQPPHVSYFIGEAEGITIAPPPLTNSGRKEIANGGTINSSHNNQQIMLAETGNMTVNVSGNASPWVVYDNAPTWVQGHNNNAVITKTTYTHTITGGAFTGSTRLVKQGDGFLALPNVTQTYTGNTDIWAGGLIFDGTMQNSRVWLNRFTALKSTGGRFNRGITMEYDAKLIPGGSNVKAEMYARSLTMNFGSRVMYDIYSDDITADQVNLDTLSINTVNWTDGPTYLRPVFQFIQHNKSGQSTPAEGAYCLGQVGTINGSLSDIIVEGLNGVSYQLAHNGQSLYLLIGNAELPQASTVANESEGVITWTFDQGTANQQATLSNNWTNYVTTSVTNGTGLTYSGTKSVSGLTETLIGVTTNNVTAADETNKLSFIVTPVNGCQLNITKIEFTASRIGTDGGKIDVSWAGNKIASALYPTRNSSSPAYTTYSYDVTTSDATAGHKLTLNIYNLGITKQIGLANIKLYGTLTQSVGAKMNSIGQQITGIESIHKDETTEKWYTLSGVRITKPTRSGVYIRNGKKVVIK